MQRETKSPTPFGTRVMNIYRNYFSFTVIKLLLLCALIIALDFAVLILENHWLKENKIAPILIGFFPFIGFFVCFIIIIPVTGFLKKAFATMKAANATMGIASSPGAIAELLPKPLAAKPSAKHSKVRWAIIMNKLAHTKYIPGMPYWYYRSEPIKGKRIEMDKFEHEMKDCDIVLRRCKGYLDGIIFSENSYFTHVGIYFKDGGERKVWHATSLEGVHATTLDEFCKCDDIAILRFSLGDTKEEKEVRALIKNDCRPIGGGTRIKDAEAKLFEELLSKTKLKNDLEEEKDFIERCRATVLDRASSLKGAPYDFFFNFKDFKKFSCIEYVWYCFKCLFPFHRIRDKDIEFFNWIRMPVIVPDVFVKNDFFEYVWASPRKGKGKEELKKLVKKGRYQFVLFVGSILFWNILILVLYSAISK